MLRRKLLSNPIVPWWYRQNLFLFSKPEIQLFADDGDFLPEEWHLINRIVTSHQLPFLVRTSLRRMAKSLLLKFKRAKASTGLS